MRLGNVSISLPAWSTGVTLALALAVCTWSACIRRTAAPPALAANTQAPVEGSPAFVALQSANARIAGLPRVDLLGGAGIGALVLRGEANPSAKVTVARIAVTGQPFAEALQADVKEGSSHEWAVQLVAPTSAPIAAGDAILATFYLRTVTPQEGGVGETELVVELAGPPYTKSVSYPVHGASEWVRVQVRFQAARAYRAGEANAIFRLGYQPEVIALGGLTVEDFGKEVALASLPTTLVQDRRREKQAAAAIKQLDASAPAVAGGELRFAIRSARTIGQISPHVYGINSQKDDAFGVTVRRMGGNRQTGYNWEINASNAGSDYNHVSDEWPCTVLGYRDCDRPGAQLVDFVLGNRDAGIESLVTIPMVDYVAADKRGPVAEKDSAPSARWNRSLPTKPGPYSLAPDLADRNVYEDELVNFLVQRLGKAGQGGIRFYSLDNEPALWPSTHPRIHPEKTRYDEMVGRTEATASAIRKIDPAATILGAVAFGWSEYLSLTDAPDAAAANARYGTYLDFFLASMKTLEDRHHARLVDVLDVHWYPEVKGTRRITEKDASPKTVAARLQAPRSLWDASYLEKSWITATWGKPIRLIPWLRERVAERYPGTKLAMTEYKFGAGDHVSGGLAQADVLGIFGREGLFIGTYWGDGPGNGTLPAYIKAAFRLYRNYDGKHGAFGDTAVEATTGDIEKASVYAATDSKTPGRLTVVVINKDLRAAFDGKLDLAGSGCTRANVFRFDTHGSDVRPQADAEVRNDEIAYQLPPLSATLFVCQRP